MAHKTWAWYDMDAYLLYMYKIQSESSWALAGHKHAHDYLEEGHAT